MKRLILASASPRRVALLQQVGYEPFACPSRFVEETVVPGENPTDYVKRQALQKAREVADRQPDDCVVLAADTVVVMDDEIIGKPADASAAMAILQRLSGARHFVLTGVAIISARAEWQTCVATTVYMRPLPEALVSWYVGTGEPLDKAGAYGIQGKGALLVEKIEGCYFNVVGLPLAAIADRLAQSGVGRV